MAGHGRKNVDEILVEALACGASPASAAQRAGVSLRTVFRRQEQPAFRQRVEKMKEETVERTSAMLTAMGIEGCRGLHDLIEKTTPPYVRLGAIRALLDMGCRLREHIDLTRRVTALEAERDENKAALPVNDPDDPGSNKELGSAPTP
jgi:hypothetical protein